MLFLFSLSIKLYFECYEMHISHSFLNNDEKIQDNLPFLKLRAMYLFLMPFLVINFSRTSTYDKTFFHITCLSVFIR